MRLCSVYRVIFSVRVFVMFISEFVQRISVVFDNSTQKKGETSTRRRMKKKDDKAPKHRRVDAKLK